MGAPAIHEYQQKEKVFIRAGIDFFFLLLKCDELKMTMIESLHLMQGKAMFFGEEGSWMSASNVILYIDFLDIDK